MQTEDKIPKDRRETSYTALYAMPHNGLRTELIAHMRQPRESRRPSARDPDARSTIPTIVSIPMHPLEIEDRVKPGHGEGNQIKSTGYASTVGTMV